MHDADWTETKDLPAEVAPWLEGLNGDKMGKIFKLFISGQSGERNDGGREEEMY